MVVIRGGLALILILTLGGCAAVWGQSYKVQFQNSSQITLLYDPALTSPGHLQGVAQTYCDGYGKDAVMWETQNATFGPKSASYLCVARE